MSKFVMVIDDSPTVRKIIETCLRREGYEVKCFADGIQAMQWLLKPEARIPDLVFVDLCLPKLDGYEVIKTSNQNLLSRVPPSSSSRAAMASSINSKDASQGPEPT